MSHRKVVKDKPMTQATGLVKCEKCGYNYKRNNAPLRNQREVVEKIDRIELKKTGKYICENCNTNKSNL